MRKRNFAAGLLAGVLAITFGAQSALAVRTAVSAVTPKSVNSGAITANSADVTMTAIDPVNHNSCILEPGMSVLVLNSHGSNPYTVTLTSAPDELQRTLDHTYSLAAGEYAIFGPITQKGWLQNDGNFYFTGENAAVKVLIIRPRNPI